MRQVQSGLARTVGLVAWLLVLGGCTTVSVSADWDPSANLASLRTWAWQQNAIPRTGDPRLDDPLVQARIQNALEHALGEMGHPELAAGKPDFYVSYHIAIQQKLDARTIYRDYGPYRGWYGAGGAQTIVDEYELGMLLVDFIDPKTNSVIWRGKAQSRLQELKTPEERQARVQAAVDQLLAQFPPKSR